MRLLLVGVVVFLVGMVRQPMSLLYEEPLEFWAPVSQLDPLSYLFRAFLGYIQPTPRAAFLVAHALDAPAVTRVIAAATLAIVGMFLASGRMATAIPNATVRLLFGLSIAFLPVSEPYISPLNSQWFLGTLAVAIALTPTRRWYDYPALVVIGLSGVAACLAALTFRDRRGLVLLAVAGVLAVYVLTSERRPGGLGISMEFAFVAALMALVLLLARTLPVRTRLAFGYLGLVTIALGSWTIAGVDGGWRYLTPAWAAIALGGWWVAVERWASPSWVVWRARLVWARGRRQGRAH